MELLRLTFNMIVEGILIVFFFACLFQDLPWALQLGSNSF